MDKISFETALSEKLRTKPNHLSSERIEHCHKIYIDYHKENNSDELLVIPMEEMAELTQHLSKLLRKKENPDDTGLLEELADVQICIDNLKIALGIDNEKLKYAMDIKFERAERKIKSRTA